MIHIYYNIYYGKRKPRFSKISENLSAERKNGHPSLSERTTVLMIAIGLAVLFLRLDDLDRLDRLDLYHRNDERDERQSKNERAVDKRDGKLEREKIKVKHDL